MKHLHTENFEDTISQEEGVFAIKFFSPTCGPCQTMVSVFEALDENNPKLNVYEVDTMVSPELASHFGVRGVPFTVFCENRLVLYEFTGVTPLRDLQYVVDNIDDPHFRETGQFKTKETKKTWWFEITISCIVMIFLSALIFL
jgi:thioredoxin 1